MRKSGDYSKQTYTHTRKAGALWTKQKEGVNGIGSKHRGRLRQCEATRRNKLPPKRWKIYNRKTLNVHQGLRAWTNEGHERDGRRTSAGSGFFLVFNC